MTGGMDTDIYRKRIEYYWGRMPLEGYACTEGGMLGMQAWNFKGMTLFPDCNFYEFIPFEEHQKNREDPGYQPETRLMNELEPGIYEFVFTNFYGGALMRYRIGDLLEVISLEDEETGIRLPQFKFYSRADDLIDLGSMARFTETSIWKALDDSGVKYEDWTARKEQDGSRAILHVYIELKDRETRPFEQIESAVLEQMKLVHTDFADMEEIFGNGQFKLSRLPKGAFNRYIEAQRAAGADLAHIKPAHMQPKDHVMDRLLQEG
jgi:phenylacetate-coenzyme A ligase PaaK-like adenylate-forming protein